MIFVSLCSLRLYGQKIMKKIAKDIIDIISSCKIAILIQLCHIPIDIMYSLKNVASSNLPKTPDINIHPCNKLTIIKQFPPETQTSVFISNKPTYQKSQIHGKPADDAGEVKCQPLGHLTQQPHQRRLWGNRS